LTEKLVEMSVGLFSFILRDYCVREWADNFVMQLTVQDVHEWWDQIVSLDLRTRYHVKTQSRGWAVVAGVTDPSNVLLRFIEAQQFHKARCLGPPADLHRVFYGGAETSAIKTSQQRLSEKRRHQIVEKEQKLRLDQSHPHDSSVGSLRPKPATSPQPMPIRD
jgi:hypothetical protein